MTEALVEQLTTMIAEALDTGWQTRADGSYTRLLKFTTPVSQLLRSHLVLAFIHGDAPSGRRVRPGEHSDALSEDGLFLRIRVLPRCERPIFVAHGAIRYNNNLFGTAGAVSA